MKRSEMVKHLKEFSDQYSPDVFCPDESHYFDSLLTAIETLGMIPPMNDNTQTSHGGYVRLWTMKWDQENET